MLLFLGKRLLQLLPTLFFVSVIIFGLQQLLPGDPALAMAGEERDPGGAGADPPAVPARSAALRAVRLLGRRRARGQPGRVDAPKGAGADSDRAEIPGHACSWR